MNWQDRLDGLYLDNDFVIHQQVEPISTIQAKIAVSNGNNLSILCASVSLR